MGPEKIDGEPGPACFGKGLNLSLMDLLAYDRKIICEGVPRARVDINRVTRLLAPLAKQLRMHQDDCAAQYIDLACSQLALEIENYFKKEKLVLSQTDFIFEGWLEPLFAHQLAKLLGISNWKTSQLSNWSNCLRLFESPLPQTIEIQQGVFQLGGAT